MFPAKQKGVNMKYLFELETELLDNAHRVYNGGKYQFAPRVVFLRSVLGDIVTSNKTNKRGAK